MIFLFYILFLNIIHTIHNLSFSQKFIEILDNSLLKKKADLDFFQAKNFHSNDELKQKQSIIKINQSSDVITGTKNASDNINQDKSEDINEVHQKLQKMQKQSRMK